MKCPKPHITNAETVDWPWGWYPSGPRSFANHALAYGWHVRMGFSRGYVPAAKEDSWDLRDFIGVLLDGYGCRAGAFWERNPEAEFSARKLESGVKPGEIPSGMNWTMTSSVIKGGGMFGFPYASLMDLREWVALKGNVSHAWYTEIQAWVLAHAENSRRKTKLAPVKKKEREHS